MILYINTNEAGGIRMAVKQGNKVVAEKKVKGRRQEAEKLLPAIEALLKNKKINLKRIKKIEVANRGGSFTSLRIGVVTANALGYALGVPVAGSQESPASPSEAGRAKVKSQKFSVVEPFYDREPEITAKKCR